MRTLRFPLIVLVILVLGAGLIIYTEQNQKANAQTNMGGMNTMALHWHVLLKMKVHGKEVPVPANVGIGTQYANHPEYDPMMQMTSMHTHDSSGIIHWERMQGPVTGENLKLGLFFDVWGKKFNSSCIFDYCDGPSGKKKMFVNGQENTDFENYQIRDRDRIEIRYE